MAKQVTKQSIAEMRAIVGVDPSEMDLIRALHLAGNDVAAAVNIYFDTPKSSFALKSKPSRRPAPPPAPPRASPQVRPSENRSNPAPSRPSIPSPSHTTTPKSPAGRPKNPAGVPNVPQVRPSPNSASPKAHSAPDRPPPVNNHPQSDSDATSSLKSTPGNACINGLEALQQSPPALGSVPLGSVPPAPTPVEDISVCLVSHLYGYGLCVNVNRPLFEYSA